jgi:tRNA C32,U32 (ribose-2'-O)-methylase TrmJ
MSSNQLTILDFRNISECYELAPKDIQTSEQHKRTKLKIQGLRAIHEDSSEVLIANLAEEIQLKYGNATFPDLQTARSLLVNRTTRTNEEIKVLSELIQKVDEKMEERKK